MLTHRIESGPWFAGLSVELRQSILARTRVRHVARGAALVHRGAQATDWIGVASGALRLGACGPDGRAFALELLSPGEWYGDIALIDGNPSDLEIHAHVASTLLLVPKAELRQLVQGSQELQQAFLQLNCRRLRHLFRRLEEIHTLPLAQRVALQVKRLTRQFGRSTPQGLVLDLAISQGDLADLLCASRQRVNSVLRQMQARGVLAEGHARIVVADTEQLAALAAGRTVLTRVAEAALR
ncbi:Crp/Fnr family transcriptional regulator [Ideonella sp. A 288]|uniref:Crp/Fnr family transcriptional regulator n=1 Tax=Ideonella sp. A 288 TaxID=1962181 RepID=UPI001303072E|nr:Crp/Fnr family transcriptional regulator [Ideonella sp. A 288]